MNIFAKILVLSSVVVLCASLENAHAQDETFDNLTLNDGIYRTPQLTLDSTGGFGPLRRTLVKCNPSTGLSVIFEYTDTFGGIKKWLYPLSIGRFSKCELSFLNDDNIMMRGSQLHLYAYPGFGMSPPWLHVDATSYAPSHRVLGVFSNRGGAAIKLENEEVQESWDLATLNNGDFRISRDGSGGHEIRVLKSGGVMIGPGNQTVFDLKPNGNLIIDGTLVQSSDRNKKENFADVDSMAILDKLARIPMQTWNYKSDDDSVRHIGPTAQDFHKQFKLGENDKTIATVDASGVNLAAIQALLKKVEILEAEQREMKQLIGELQSQLESSN